MIPKRKLQIYNKKRNQLYYQFLKGSITREEYLELKFRLKNKYDSSILEELQ